MNQEHEPCGLECDCTDVCKQDNYKALWQQMCERCDELDKQLAQQAKPLESISYIPCCTDQTCPKCKAAIPPLRQPLTDDEILEMWGLHDVHLGIVDFVRSIEAAHGIKGEA